MNEAIAWQTVFTLSKVKSSLIIPLQPDVPNLISSLFSIYVPPVD
jgi:hypothetical protein